MSRRADPETTPYELRAIDMTLSVPLGSKEDRAADKGGFVIGKANLSEMLSKTYERLGISGESPSILRVSVNPTRTVNETGEPVYVALSGSGWADSSVYASQDAEGKTSSVTYSFEVMPKSHLLAREPGIVITQIADPHAPRIQASPERRKQFAAVGDLNSIFGREIVQADDEKQVSVPKMVKNQAGEMVENPFIGTISNIVAGSDAKVFDYPNVIVVAHDVFAIAQNTVLASLRPSGHDLKIHAFTPHDVSRGHVSIHFTFDVITLV